MVTSHAFRNIDSARISACRLSRVSLLSMKRESSVYVVSILDLFFVIQTESVYPSSTYVESEYHAFVRCYTAFNSTGKRETPDFGRWISHPISPGHVFFVCYTSRVEISVAIMFFVDNSHVFSS